MIVGLVIFTFPRRPSVSQAFKAATPSARPEIAIVIGSAKCLGALAPSVANAVDHYAQYYAHPTLPPATTGYDAPIADPPQALENTTPSQPRATQANHSSSPESWFGSRRPEVRILSPRPIYSLVVLMRYVLPIERNFHGGAMESEADYPAPRTPPDPNRCIRQFLKTGHPPVY